MSGNWIACAGRRRLTTASTEKTKYVSCCGRGDASTAAKSASVVLKSKTTDADQRIFLSFAYTHTQRERERQSARHLHFFSFSFFFDRSMERGLEPVVYTVGRGAGFLRPTTGCRKTADGRHLAAASCEPLRPGVSSQMSAVISHDGGSTIVMWTLRHTEQKKTTQKKATTSPSFSFPPLWWTGGTRWK